VLEPAGLAAGMIRVRALARLGRAAEATAAGDSLVALHPGDPAALGALGAARLAAGDAAGAVGPLGEASRHLLDDAGLAWDLGRAAIAMGDVPLAREAFERAVTAAPESYDAWLGVADTRSRLGDAAGAQAALQRAEGLPGASDGRAAALRARIAQRLKP
jgi:tetratricopeptide (TPR) repeat protein